MSYQVMNRYRGISKISQAEKATYSDLNYMAFQKKENGRDNKKISGCQGLNGGEG